MGIFEREAQAGSMAGDDVARCDPTLMLDAILAAVEQGWLLSFGSSRDGGAVQVSILNDEGRQRQWCSGTEELETALRAVVTAAGGTAASTAAEQASRGSTGPTGASGGKAAGQGKPSKSGA